MKEAAAAFAAESQRRRAPNASLTREAASAVMLPCVVMQSISRILWTACPAWVALWESDALSTLRWTAAETERAKSDGEDMRSCAQPGTLA